MVFFLIQSQNFKSLEAILRKIQWRKIILLLRISPYSFTISLFVIGIGGEMFGGKNYFKSLRKYNLNFFQDQNFTSFGGPRHLNIYPGLTKADVGDPQME